MLAALSPEDPSPGISAFADSEDTRHPELYKPGETQLYNLYTWVRDREKRKTNAKEEFKMMELEMENYTGLGKKQENNRPTVGCQPVPVPDRGLDPLDGLHSEQGCRCNSKV